MRTGRPPLPPGEVKSTRVVLSLNQADLARLDRLVETDEWGAETRQDLLTFLLREEYQRRGLKPARKRSQRSKP